jgi:mannose-1-phosphate guanylyltransferase
MRFHPVILAGGRGERFWPLSRRARPKQILPLLSDRPMVADTLERLRGLADPKDAWIITSRDLRAAVRKAVPSVPRERIIGEPVGKNTAPAVALAAWWLRGLGSDVVAAVLPSDHRVEPAPLFREELAAAAKAALDLRAIVVLGVPPTRPDTGYGYIEAGEPVAAGSALRNVIAFREKPDASTAARYVEDGRHLWNAGIFVFAPEVMLEEIRLYEPGLAALLSKLPDRPGRGTDAALERYYAAAPSISIDYAVMERTRRAVVARAGFAWDDLGSWAALETQDTKDAHGNFVRGRAFLHDSTGVIAFSDGGLVAGIGIKDLVVVHTGDVTLVCPRDRAQEVRALVERIKKEKDADALL